LREDLITYRDILELQRMDQARQRHLFGAKSLWMNRIDEALNEFLKKKYGDCIKECKLLIEVEMQLKGDNYEIIGAYFPKEELELKIK